MGIGPYYSDISMPKLHLKRTPEEEAAHRLRKMERKEAKRRRESQDNSSRKRRQTDNFSDNEESKYRPDYEAIRAELEEQQFREKMAMAFEEDERQDNIEARFNSFAHVPIHWGGNRGHDRRIDCDSDEFLAMDPMTMDDEEYAEWIRTGMYRKTHAQEIAEKERKQAERAAKRAQKKAIRAETKRLDKLAAEERRSRKREKESQRLEQLHSEYRKRWKILLSIQPADELDLLSFNDIPWPVVRAHPHSKRDNELASHPQDLSLDDFNRDAISLFLFASSSFTSADAPHVATDSGDIPSLSTEGVAERETKAKKDRKNKLREAFLRYHPDKFESRLMSRVRPAEQNQVRQALGVVVRVLNDLMAET